MKISQIKSLPILSVVIGLLTIIPFFIVCWFSLPAADDYCSVLFNDFGKKSFLDFFSYHYQSLTGRYTSIVMFWLSPIQYFSVHYYFVALWIILTVLFLALAWVIRIYFSSQHNLLDFILITLIVFALLLNCFINIPETLFWYTGLVTYLMGFIFFLLSLIALNYSTQSAVARFCYCVTLFLAIGTGEINTIGISICCTLFFYVQKRKINFGILVTLAAGIIVSICAPGNFVRTGIYHHTGSVSDLFFQSTLQTFRFTGLLLGHSALILFFIFMLIAGRFAERETTARRYNPIVLFLFGLFILYVSCFLPIAFTGILGQWRTIDGAIPYVLFLWSWSAYDCLWFYKLEFVNKDLLAAWFRKHKYKLSIVYFVLITMTGNQILTLSDLFTGKTKAHRDEKLAQMYDIGVATDSKLVNVASLGTHPQSVFNYDIVPGDSGSYINTCAYEYFKNRPISKKIKAP